MSYCYNCGQRLVEGENFCHECGRPTAKAQSNTANQQHDNIDVIIPLRAVLGKDPNGDTEVEVVFPHTGKTARVKIPNFFQAGNKLRLPGAGLITEGGRKGDVYIHLIDVEYTHTETVCKCCGHPLEKGAKFCSKCGAAVNGNAEEKRTTQEDVGYSVFGGFGNIKGAFESVKQNASKLKENVSRLFDDNDETDNIEHDDNAKYASDIERAKETEKFDNSYDFEKMSTSERKMTYDGVLHKCPNCGEGLTSFTTKCPCCGHELRDVRNSVSVREFAAKLETIERNRPAGKQKSDDGICKTDKQKISLIRSFAIPNTKEDLFEFLVLASSNINLQRYNDFDGISTSEEAVSDAWEAKFEQAYEKAKLSFGDTLEFKKIQEVYKKKSGQIDKSKKKRAYSWVLYVLFIVGLFAFVFGIREITEIPLRKENQRLEQIAEEVYEAIEEENFVMARAKAATLVFSVHNGYEKEYVETWNQKRENLLEVIDAAEAQAKDDQVENADKLD